MLQNFQSFSCVYTCRVAFYRLFFCCISTHVVFDLTFLVLALFDVVLFADVHAIVEYIYSDECIVYFLVYWCRVRFFYNDFYLLFCATFCAVFCVDKCGACDVLRLFLFCFLCCIQKLIYKWLGVYVVLYWFWLLFYLFYTKSSWLLLFGNIVYLRSPPSTQTKH